MRHGGTIFIIGLVLMVMPLIGFPAVWKSFFITVSGLWLCGIVFSARFSRHQPKVSQKTESRYSDITFVENKVAVESLGKAVSDNIHDQPPKV